MRLSKPKSDENINIFITFYSLTIYGNLKLKSSM